MIRYTNSDKTIIINNEKSYEFKQTKITPQKDHYFIYEIKSRDRLDVLSNKYYHNPLYWYVIARINPNIDVFELEEGTKIKIIHPQFLRYYV